MFAFASSSRLNTQHNLKCIPWVVIVIFIISPPSWSSSWLPSPSPSPWSSSSSSPSSSSSSSSASSPVETRQGMFRYSDNHSPSPFSITFLYLMYNGTGKGHWGNLHHLVFSQQRWGSQWDLSIGLFALWLVLTSLPYWSRVRVTLGVQLGGSSK